MITEDQLLAIGKAAGYHPEVRQLGCPQLLGFAKIENGKWQYTIMKEDFKRIIEAVETVV